ncbi:NAD(P)-dependent oxidoreductase [Thalassobaculum sp.]|uniref:NAD-dependent epimerase/dehydratase family protein n=1 Tax=Thalassobaculum sp. TaxID=2022740 RepID=UPI0032EC640D
MRVLVTGAAGFSGRTIARHLVAAGCEVVAHRRSSPLPDDLLASSAVTDWPGDLNAVETLPDGIDAVVHAAATSPPTGRADAVPAEALIRDNALATARLVAASKLAGVGRFIYLSSVSIHGTVAERSLDATTPVRDPDPYGVSKLIGESVLAASGLNGLAIRLPAVIGSGADRNWPVQVVGRIRRRETVRIYNADGPFNNVVHVDDLARWIVAVVTSGKAASGFNAMPVASSEPIAVRVAVATLAAGLGLNARLEEVVAPRAAFLIETTAAEGLGFRPSSTVDALDRYARAPD